LHRRGSRSRARRSEDSPAAISLFTAAVFLDSLRFKFTDHPNTQEIFGRLDGWAGDFGLSGLFGRTGLFSQYVIGSAELVASTLLIVGLLPRFARLNALGALIGLAVMTGAVSFHLFTPLGIDPNNDGGGLFAAACTIWITSIVLLFIRRNDLTGLIGDLGRAVVPTRRSASSRMRAPAHAQGL
jgi:uncharacterized membrane protein YphA (DoxX/SURF4 family)